MNGMDFLGVKFSLLYYRKEEMLHLSIVNERTFKIVHRIEFLSLSFECTK